MPTRLRLPQTARRLASATAIAAVGVAIALGTTGCGAGQISQTANQLPAVNGANANATWGPIELRNVQILYPAAKAGEVFGAGGPFEVSFSIINSSETETYKLSRVEVTQQGAPANAAITISGNTAAKPGTMVRAGNPANVLGGSSVASSSAASATTMAPGGSAMTATLNNTGKSVAAGLTTELTFHFEKEDGTEVGTVAVQTPVDTGTLLVRQDPERGMEPDEAHGEGGGH